MPKNALRCALLTAASAAFPFASGMGEDLKKIDIVSSQDGTSITVVLSSLARSAVTTSSDSSGITICFPNSSFGGEVYKSLSSGDGIRDIRIDEHCGQQHGTSIAVGIESTRPYRIVESGNVFSLRFAPVEHERSDDGESPNHAANGAQATGATGVFELAADAHTPPLEVESPPINAAIDETPRGSEPELRRRFKVKFVAANNAYIDGGSSSGLRMGMNLDVLRLRPPVSGQQGAVEMVAGSAHVVGVAANSAVLEYSTVRDDLKTGDLAELSSSDATTVARDVTRAQKDGPQGPTLARLPTSNVIAASTRWPANGPATISTRMSGRIGFDYGGITGSGSTFGSSAQMGVLLESNMQHILGTHWNLEGYYRKRVNQHSQFQERTIEETLSKTYTMQLYYDNPDSKWVAGLGRLYLPWAVSLDTVDGGYLARKNRFGMTTGLFAGSTPDISSWHYRPNQRIGGLFTGLQWGSYEKIHVSSTAGAALSSIRWKLDRPFLFFENEISYKGTISIYHSLILDSPQGVSTGGVRPGAGVSHSYFTLHYQPFHALGLDLYQNFFRDIPTAVTTAIATGTVDTILFQGTSAGAHWKPSRQFALYTNMGISDRSGDSHRSFNRMFGATWFDLVRSGVRADFHYSKFNSNFGNGEYSALTFSRQVTSHMFSNLQLANQDLHSEHSTNDHSRFISDSLDVNLGRHTYIQSGYTIVDGATLNYRQWYASLGYRFDTGKTNPEFVKTLNQH
ncbi:MAG TPA: hypothetical protein VGL22_12135 [Terracidiphilus sp.]